MIGQTITHYKVLEKLGEGGMGVVYKAEDTKLKRNVALKFLPKELTRDQTAKERFYREAQAAAALNHPNIVTIYEIDEYEEQTYIAMEHIEGQTIKDMISSVGARRAVPAVPDANNAIQPDVGAGSKPARLDKTIDIVIQICEGLAKAHQAGIVHRDIKPQNIIIDKDGRVKILDFGLAKLKGVSPLTKEATTVGTINYMSPEQTQGADVDQRTDIWSFGIIFYEMLTGQLPFKGEYAEAVIYSIMNEDPEPLSNLLTGVPPELERIVNKTLSKAPAERYQHTDDLLADLRKLNKDSDSEMLSAKYINTKSKGKPGKRSLIPGILLLSAVILISGYFIFKEKAEEKYSAAGNSIQTGTKKSIAIMYFENNTGDEKLDYWRSALAELMITDLSQSKLISVLPGDRLFGILKKLDLLESKKYSTEDLLKVAARGKTNHIIRGNYIKIGENFRINIMIYKADSGDLINSLTVECMGEKDVLSKVDEVTKKIKLNFDYSEQEISEDIDREIGKITTSSIEAYKNYITGVKLHQDGKFREAIRYYKNAVVIDPGFATAYRSMAMAAANIGDFKEMKKNIQKSFELSDRISDRERYRNQAEFYVNIENDEKAAMAAYKKLLELYPEDLGGHHQLGVLYRDMEEWDKAIDEYKISIRDEGVLSYSVLAEAYEAKGQYDRAEELLGFYINNILDSAYLHRQIAHNHILKKSYESAIAEAEKASSLTPVPFFDFRLKGDIYTYKGDMIKSEQEYRKLLDSGGILDKLHGRLMLSSLSLLSGRFNESINHLKPGLKLAKTSGQSDWHNYFIRSLIYIYIKSGNLNEALKMCNNEWHRAVEEKNLGRQIEFLHYKGIALAEKKSLELAQKTAKELDESIKKGMYQKLLRYYYNLIGVIESKRNHSAKAVEYFEKAIAMLSHQYSIYTGDPHALLIEPLAFVFYDKGDLTKAQGQYEEIISLTTGRLFYGDIYVNSFYMLGKIYRQKGWKNNAIESYKKFIELWQDCDLQFQPLVEDARKRVEELEGIK